VESKGFALYDRFPGLATLPRAALGVFPSPVERLRIPGGPELWLKRDDRNAPVAAGNKVRALEFLLGPVHAGDHVLAVGGEGSTHVYATSVHAERLGARTDAIRWAHAMHPVSHAVARAIECRCASESRSRWIMVALARAAAWRIAARASGGGRHYLPLGGSNSIGVLGHVNAGLELAGQIADGLLPTPTHVVLPLGTGGTAAGLALGLGVAGVKTTIVAARVAPWPVANLYRVHALIRRTRRLIRRYDRSGSALPAAPIVVDHSVYGGEYGRPLAAGTSAAALFRRAAVEAGGEPLTLDATYAAKAAAAALALATSCGAGSADRRVLLWVTFDGRPFADADLLGGGAPQGPP
jgi:1-aminocyclopropane-1-carboxylate deaminase/D-cysteine desulfhydrase-like pyridoxal-dependent ACC family enzyme